MYRTATLVTALLLAAAAILSAVARETERERSVGRGSSRAGGRTERCVSCHVRPEEDPGGAHARAALGCASCHLGNPLAFGAARAHAGMEPEPGALATVAFTCGRSGCHPREAEKVASSLMARGSGMIGVDRFAFGEASTPESVDTMSALVSRSRPSPAEDHLRKLCAGCHLGARRANRDDAIRGNGSGCSACHVARRREGEKRAHPPVDARVGDDRCFGCHSRSGRIALTYQGLYEIEPAQRAGLPSDARVESLEGGRPVRRTEADVHLASGLGCVDCHLHTDLMGDGTRRAHEEEQVEITCEACHGPVAVGGEKPWGSLADPITRDLLRSRGETRPVVEEARLGRRGTPVWNLRPAAGGGWVLLRKGDGKGVAVKQTPRDRNHLLKGHERLSCSACHAAWAPTCATCHTAYDPGGKQWDFAAGAERAGRWTESSEGFAAAPPALGVRGDGRIVPAIPGMVMTLATGAVGGGRERAVRLYAPIEPHSTGTRARSCAACHSAEGARLLAGSLPWTGTRVGFRPLSPEELRRIAAVAANPAFRTEMKDGRLDSRPPTP